jgi:hypothetical protein
MTGPTHNGLAGAHQDPFTVGGDHALEDRARIPMHVVATFPYVAGVGRRREW